MTRTLLSALLILSTAITAMASPPITLFKTLKDFQAGKGSSIGDFEGYEWNKGNMLLFTPPIKGKKPVEHDVTAHWGFSIGEHSFRMYQGVPHIILKQGKGIYYENGLAHIDMTLDKKDGSDIDYGKYCFISKTIDSPIVYVPSKDATKAFEKDADIQPFLLCIEKFKWTDAKKIRGCMGKLD